MPRTDVAITVLTGPFPTASLGVTWQAADVANQNQATLTGKEFLLARNTTGGSLNVTVTGSANDQGRTGGAVPQAVAAGATAVFGPYTDLRGWAQGTKLFFGSTNAGMLFAVVRFP